MPVIPRTTTVGSLKNYRYDLNRSSYTMYQSMQRVDTQRQFNSFAEDPTAAARCFQLRRSYLRTSAQYDINTSVYSKYQQAWKALDSVSQDVDTVTRDNAFASILTSLNDADRSGRNALGQSMVAKADSIIQTMNGRYGENFIFSGADTLNVPFTWETHTNPQYIEEPDPTNADHAAAFKYLADPAKTNDATILYTNDPAMAQTKPKDNPWYLDGFDDPDYIDDNMHKYPYLDEEGNPTDNDGDPAYTGDMEPAAQEPVANPNYDEIVTYKYLEADGFTGTNDPTRAGRSLCYRGIPVDQVDVNSPDSGDINSLKMQYFLQEETKYMDLGLGYEETDGTIVPTSVFNVALQGAYYLGGTGTSTQTVTIRGETREIEVPNNIVSIIDQMGNVLLRCDPDNGEYASTDDEFYSLALARQFESQAKIVKQRYDELDTRSSFLRDNGELLVNKADTLSEQFMALEDIDPAAAITDFMYAKYCYDTALKVGNSILSQSLMDYLNL